MISCTAKLLSPTEVLITGPSALWEWREAQQVEVPGARFTPRYKRGQWDGFYTPGKWCQQTSKGQWEMRCSVGLLGRLSSAFTILWEGEPPQEHLQHCLLPQEQIDKLRDLQRDALLAAIRHRWGRLALATNAGKGAVIALLADLARQHNVQVLILCDELAVFDALGRDSVEGVPGGQLYKWANLTPGFVQHGAKNPPTDPVVLAMVPTLAHRLSSNTKALEKRLQQEKITALEFDEEVPKIKARAKVWRQWVAKRGMLLLDEADKATAATWKLIISNAKGSTWRLGFSGTFPDPEEKPYDDLRLDELMGPILIQAKNIDLIKDGVSAKPLVELVGFNATHAIIDNIPKGEWWKLPGPTRRLMIYESAIAFNHDRNQFIATLVRPNTPTAIIVNRIAHGKALHDVLLDNAVGAVFLDGSCPLPERQKVLEQFQNGVLKVLVITKILDRGTNRLGIAADILFASGEGSSRQTLQRIGRGLRRTGGKEFLRLVDIVDRVDKDAFPRSRYLARAAKLIHGSCRKRIQLYHNEGFEVGVPYAS